MKTPPDSVCRATNLPLRFSPALHFALQPIRPFLQTFTRLAGYLKELQLGVELPQRLLRLGTLALCSSKIRLFSAA